MYQLSISSGKGGKVVLGKGVR